MNLKRKPQQGGSNPTPTSAQIQAGGLTLRWDLDRDQYLYGIDVSFLGRLTTGGGNAAAVNAEAGPSLINRMRVSMNHPVWGARTIVNLSGASVFRRAHIMNGTAPVNAGGLAVAQAAYDMEVHWPCPFVLENLPDPVTRQMLLDAPNCSNLVLELDINPGAALLPTGGATTWTWAAFGGGGNPRFDVTLIQPNGFKAAPKSALVTRIDRNDPITAAVGIDNQIGNPLILKGFLARTWLKQYVNDPLVAIDVAFTMNNPQTLAATGLVTPQFQVDRKAIRQWTLFTQLQQEGKVDNHLEAWPNGYGLINFMEDGVLSDAMDANFYSMNGHTLAIAGLVNALANGRLEVGFDTFEAAA